MTVTPPDKEAFYYYHLDHLGTPIAMTDESKTIVWSSDYYPFGTTLDETVVQDNEFRFPGQYRDRETDLYYNWHRYYDSRVGRYTTADPLGLGAGDVNLYRYAGSKPTMNGDFLGLDWYEDDQAYYWFEPDEQPRSDVGLEYHGPALVDLLGNAVDPASNDFVVYKGGETFHSLFHEGKEFFSDLENWRSHLKFASCVREGGLFDIKNRADLVFGRGYGKYTAVGPMVLQNQDWGNILYTMIGKEAGFTLLELHIGAGLAQLFGGHSHWYWVIFGYDEPRDFIIIELTHMSTPDPGVPFNGGSIK